MSETAVATRFRHSTYLWDDSVASVLKPVEQLIYRSNLLGSDQRITNTGGGNTSSKVIESDPLTGAKIDVLWVKGSGGDLRTAKRDGFSSLYLDRVLALEGIYGRTEPRGVKTPIEDQMVASYLHCTFNLNPRASSIDTPLHAFVPYRYVDHMHPNAVIAVAAAARSRELCREIYGDEVIWTPWQRPGFDLALKLRDICHKHPKARGVLLSQHGIINWADENKECYDLTLDLIERAGNLIEAHDCGDQTFGGQRYDALPPEQRDEVLFEILPWLRGQVSGQKRLIGTVHSDAAVLRFVNSVDAPRLAELGTSCPDHFLRTKIKPLLVDWNPRGGDISKLRSLLEAGIQQYRKDYADYYQRCKRPDSPAMRDPNPTVILIPGVGLIAWSKDKSESRATAEFYLAAIEVMRGAEAIDEYIALPQQEAFDIEYWALEEAKLRRMPPEKELARRVVVVVGAGNGIGRAATKKLSEHGAHVVCADLSRDDALAAATEIEKKLGSGTGVAGTGVSSCAYSLAVEANITQRDSVRGLLRDAVLAYGGVDGVVVTAGVYVSADASGHMPDTKWRQAFDVNVIGAYVVADEARQIWARQQLSGALVLTTSVNAVVSKRGSLAYDTSKAAANHLVRELAIELAPYVRVNGVAPATVVAGSTMFPRERVMASLAKYEIAYSNDETTEQLRDKLARFYADRTLLKAPIRPEDQAESVFFLISDRSARTTGQIISVDGGLAEAFLR